MSASAIINTLWSATDAEGLSDEQLLALGCVEDLACQLKNIAEAVLGIGCLVAEDEDAGSFQDAGSVSRLLFSLSDVISANAEASIVSSEAKAIIQRRKLERTANQVTRSD